MNKYSNHLQTLVDLAEQATAAAIAAVEVAEEQAAQEQELERWNYTLDALENRIAELKRLMED